MPLIDEDEALGAIRLFKKAKHFYDIKNAAELKSDLKAAAKIEEIPMDLPLLDKIKGAALQDVFKSLQKTLTHGGPVTRSAIARNGLERGIERRNSIGIDKRKSGESSIKERRSLLSVFSRKE